MSNDLQICLVALPSDEPKQLDDLTVNLMLDLDSVVTVSRSTSSDIPAGAKAIDAALIGHLFVVISHSGEALASIVKLLSVARDWLGRQDNRTIKLELGDNKLELSGVSNEEQKKLIQAWLDAVERSLSTRTSTLPDATA
jgi:hypothetical protein